MLKGHTYSATQSGNYTVIVTSGGCSATSSAVTVMVNAVSVASATPTDNTTFCAGGSIQFNGNFGSGYNYQWYRNDNLINGVTTINYTATQAVTIR